MDGVLAAGTVPAPTLGSALTAWTPDPASLVLVAALGLGYLALTRRLRRAGQHWSAGRTASWLIGVLAIGMAGTSWLGVYSHALFSAAASQLILLLVIAPILLAVGAPLSLLVRAAPPAVSGRVQRLLGGRAMRVLSYPVLGTLLLALVPLAVYFTGWFELTMRNAAAYEAQILLVPLLGLALVWPLGELELLGEGFSHPLAVFISFVELLVDAIPGIIIRLSTHVIGASYYAGLQLGWTRDRLLDQQLGGALWWFFGEIVDIPVMGILVARWLRADSREAARIDAALDEASAAGRTAAGQRAGGRPSVGHPAADQPATSQPSDGQPEPEPELMRPWWEEDPSVFGARARFYRRGGAEEEG